MKKYTKKNILIFILIAFAITMILWPLAAKQSIRTTHENPGTAQTGFSVSMTNILDYSDIAYKIASGQFEEIEDIIKEFSIDDLPADIQFIIQTYNDLLSDLTMKLNNLDAILEEVELLLSQSEFDETSLKLTDADYLVEDIESSLEDMDNANEQIESIMGSFTPKEQTEVAEELRAWLLEDIESLETLKEEYEASAPQKIPTGLILEVPEQIYPGLPYKISGQITYDDNTPSIERDVKLLWDNLPIDTVYTYRDQSVFEIEVTPDENTILGEHILKVIIEANDQYSNASENVTLIVVQDLPEIKIDDLSYKILSRKVQVRGKVESETPLQESIVIIARKGTSTSISISPDGEFEALLGLPLGVINIGEQDIKIRFVSSKVWQSSTEVTAEIFILDIFSIGFISTAFIAIGMIIYVRRRGGLGKGESRIEELPTSPESTQEYTNLSLREFEEEDLKGTRGQIFRAYTETTKMVENVTKVVVEPYMTLREFLKETTPKLNGAVQAFTELTCLTEDALYSPRMPGLDDAERAESLVTIVKETLKS